MIKKLAQAIYDSKAKGEPFVLLLGNGASVNSGIKPNSKIVEEILKEHGEYEPTLKAQEIISRFNQIWDRDREVRETFHEKYLSGRPSKGYTALAHLLQRGYFAPVFSLNFDNLLEKALDQAGNERNYQVIYRSPESDERLAERLRAELLKKSDQRPAIVKLHKPYEVTSFLYTTGDLQKYSPSLESALYEYFSRNIVVCGYSLRDRCITNVFALNPQIQGDFYYVSPRGYDGGDTQQIADIQTKRRKTYEIEGDLGTFDSFFCSLWEEIFSLSLRKEFPYPIARSFSLLEQASSTNERFGALHNLFGNALKFLCAIVLADYPALRKRIRTADEEFSAKVKNILQEFDLRNIDILCSLFHSCFGTVSSDFFNEPVIAFLKEYPELRAITEKILAWSADTADANLYEEQRKEVLHFLLRLDFLRSYELNVMSYNVNAIINQFTSLSLKGDDPSLWNTVAPPLAGYCLQLLRSSKDRHVARGISLDPFLVVDGTTNAEGIIMPDVYFYHSGYGVV